MAEAAKVVLVTGVGKGIGYALAKNLLNRGHKVVGISRNLSAWESAPSGFYGLALDLLKDAAPRAIEEFLSSKELVLDGLVHNAGMLTMASLEDLQTEDFERMMRLHVTVPLLLTQSLLPRLGKGSHVVLVGSMSGYTGAKKYRGLSAYGASKAALMSFAETWSVDLLDRNIQVNALALGACETDMLRIAFPDSEVGMSVDALGKWMASFVLEGHTCINGRLIPVALLDPL